MGHFNSYVKLPEGMHKLWVFMSVTSAVIKMKHVPEELTGSKSMKSEELYWERER